MWVLSLEDQQLYSTGISTVLYCLHSGQSETLADRSGDSVTSVRIRIYTELVGFLSNFTPLPNACDYHSLVMLVLEDQQPLTIEETLCSSPLYRCPW